MSSTSSNWTFEFSINISESKLGFQSCLATKMKQFGSVSFSSFKIFLDSFCCGTNDQLLMPKFFLIQAKNCFDDWISQSAFIANILSLCLNWNVLEMIRLFIVVLILRLATILVCQFYGVMCKLVNEYPDDFKLLKNSVNAGEFCDSCSELKRPLDKINSSQRT